MRLICFHTANGSKHCKCIRGDFVAYHIAIRRIVGSGCVEEPAIIGVVIPQIACKPDSPGSVMNRPLFPESAGADGRKTTGIGCSRIRPVGTGTADRIVTLERLITTPETWVPNLGGDLPTPAHGFPYLSAAGRLVIKDIIMMAGGLLVATDCARRILSKQQKQA
ncbi:MAG: hypothetical protein BGP01_01445 [Paludibacter sp. 47-17]|nr:MAG: hypothetical protein BGP01_01445 [Paludibacter sp. 47-17]